MLTFAAPGPILNETLFRHPLHVASRAFLENQDVLEERVSSGRVPDWLARDSESLDWILALSANEVHTWERYGLSQLLRSRGCGDVPERISRLEACAAEVRSCFPKCPNVPAPTTRARRVRPRKQLQVSAVVNAVTDMIRSSERPLQRIVDIGGGHGHLSRSLVEHGLPLRVVCLDRDEKLLATGEMLTLKKRGYLPDVQFVQADAAVAAGAGVGSKDCAVGLHACGRLGDQICVDAASDGGAGAVLLVSCCLQKIGDDAAIRRPLSRAGSENYLIRSGLSFARRTLGLSNRALPSSGEPTAQLTRVALRILLEGRGHAVESPSKIVHGLSRHRVKRGLRDIADNALQLRGDFRYASDEEVARCVQAAEMEYSRMRVMSLPRNELGSLMEMAVVLDRAALLTESRRFGSVRTLQLFPESVSARNLAIIAR